MRQIILVLFFTFVSTQFSLAQEPSKPDPLAEQKAEVDISCASEGEIARCGTKTTGNGLMNCIKKHRDKTSGFKISKPCKKAMLKLQRAAKAKKHEQKKRQKSSQ